MQLRSEDAGADEHETAFRRYFRQVGERVGAKPATFRVVDARPVAAGDGSSISELVLRGTAPIWPGDMLYAWWSNPADVVEAREGDGAVAHWTTPLACRPARRTRSSADELLRDVVDLSARPAGSAAELARTAPRIVPRLYTTAGIVERDSETEVRLVVGRRDSWPDRAAAHLHRAAPGDELRAWVLPHPHRLPSFHGHGARGIAVVTGSGIAGVLAALRTGRDLAVWLIWGLRGEVAPDILAELEAYRSAGVIRRLDIVDSSVGGYVTGVLAERADDVRAALVDGDWVYVSGHRGMAQPVRDQFTTAVGEGAVAAMSRELRYVEST